MTKITKDKTNEEHEITDLLIEMGNKSDIKEEDNVIGHVIKSIDMPGYQGKPGTCPIQVMLIEPSIPLEKSELKCLSVNCNRTFDNPEEFANHIINDHPDVIEDLKTGTWSGIGLDKILEEWSE